MSLLGLLTTTGVRKIWLLRSDKIRKILQTKLASGGKFDASLFVCFQFVLSGLVRISSF